MEILRRARSYLIFLQFLFYSQHLTHKKEEVVTYNEPQRNASPSNSPSKNQRRKQQPKKKDNRKTRKNKRKKKWDEKFLEDQLRSINLGGTGTSELDRDPVEEELAGSIRIVCV